MVARNSFWVRDPPIGFCLLSHRHLDLILLLPMSSKYIIHVTSTLLFTTQDLGFPTLSLFRSIRGINMVRPKRSSPFSLLLTIHATLAVCMTDSMGLSGGCQDLYTVYPSGVTSCQNVTVPAKILGVKMTSLETGGPLSRFGWPSSCTDLQFDMVDGLEGGVIGRPPYTLSIAPVFRPPLNMTFRTYP